MAPWLWRRRWLVLGIAWPICLAGWIAVALLPSKYVATARVYVDTETLLSPLLKGMAVDVDMNQQVEVMQRTLLSRPNLQKVKCVVDGVVKKVWVSASAIRSGLVVKPVKVKPFEKISV